MSTEGADDVGDDASESKNKRGLNQFQTIQIETALEGFMKQIPKKVSLFWQDNFAAQIKSAQLVSISQQMAQKSVSLSTNFPQYETPMHMCHEAVRTKDSKKKWNARKNIIYIDIMI